MKTNDSQPTTLNDSGQTESKIEGEKAAHSAGTTPNRNGTFVNEDRFGL